MSREEALLERSRLLKNVGMSIEDLRTRAAEYTLNDAEFIIWQRIEDLNWLLGE